MRYSYRFFVFAYQFNCSMILCDLLAVFYSCGGVNTPMLASGVIDFWLFKDVIARNKLSGWRDLNPRSSGPKPDALAPRLHPAISKVCSQSSPALGRSLELTARMVVILIGISYSVKRKSTC